MMNNQRIEIVKLLDVNGNIMKWFGMDIQMYNITGKWNNMESNDI